MRKIVLTALALGALSACAPKAEVDELNAKVEALSKRVETLESRPASAGATAGPSAADEAKAQELYGKVNEALAAGNTDEAKTQLAVLLKDYGSTKTASRAVRTKAELDVVGKKVGTPEIDKWFQGSEADLDLAGGTTLVVFWEVWCPHCRREVPEMQALHEKYKGQMAVVGLTKITKSATEEKVTEFIAEQGVTYPMAKETGKASAEFAVSGIPAAAVVKDGEVVWRGHPGRLTEEMLEGFIKG